MRLRALFAEKLCFLQSVEKYCGSAALFAEKLCFSVGSKKTPAAMPPIHERRRSRSLYCPPTEKQSFSANRAAEPKNSQLRIQNFSAISTAFLGSTTPQP